MRILLLLELRYLRVQALQLGRLLRVLRGSVDVRHDSVLGDPLAVRTRIIYHSTVGAARDNTVVMKHHGAYRHYVLHDSALDLDCAQRMIESKIRPVSDIR